jgi:hypothetical protein
MIVNAGSRQAGLRCPSGDGGWILMELSLSISLLAMLIVGLGVSQNTFGRLNQYELVQQHCVAAATAEIHQFLATGHEIARPEARRLWPDVQLTLRQSPGQGPWAGLTLVEAFATGQSRGKEVRVELRRYAPVRPAPKGESSP